MTLFVEKGTFTKRSGTGSQTVTLADSGLTPKVLWLWTSGATADNTYNEGHMWGFGFSDGTNDACLANISVDASASSSTITHYRQDSVLTIPSMTTPATILERCDVTSFNAGNFILNWITSDTTLNIIHYFVMGGTDITNVLCQNTTMGTNTTGSKSKTGIGFQGNFMMVIHPDLATTTNSASATPGFGAAISSTKEWAFSTATANSATTSSTWSAMRSSTAFMQGIGSLTTGTTDFECDFTSFDSDGYTFNVSDANSNVGQTYSALIIKGGLWDLGTGTAPATATSQTITTTSGRDAKGIMMLTWGNTSTSAISIQQCRVSIGAGDNALNEGCTSSHDLHGQATAQIGSRISKTDKLIRAHTATATATSSTLLAECDLTDMASDGTIGINWSTTLSGMAYVWFSVSETFAAGTNYSRTASDTITISDVTVDRIKSAARAPSTDSSTVADSSLTRMLSASRSPTADTIAIADSSILRSKTWPRSPSADTTTVADSSLVRMLSATRAPSLDTLTIGESPTRMLSAFRLPTSDTITVADSSLVRSKTWVRLPTADTITVSDSSLTRLLSAARSPSTDTTAITDVSLTRMKSALRIPSTDTVTTSESAVGGKVYGRIPSTDTVTIVDSSLTRLLSAIRIPATDTIASTENLIRILSASRVTSSDTTTVADAGTPVRVRSLIRTPSADSATVVDSSLTRMLSSSRAPNQDTITVADSSLTRIKSALRIISLDTTTTSESLTVTQSQTILRSPAADSTTITDGTLSRILSATRVPSSDTVTVTDSSLTRLLQLVRTRSDTVTLSESVSSALTTPGLFSRSASDTVTIVEASLIRLLSSIRVPSTDTSAVSESVIRIATRIRTPSTDNVIVGADTVARLRTVIRLPTQDTANIIEASLIRLLSLRRSASDATVISEVQSAISHSRALLETINITEPLIQRIVSASRNASDIIDIDEQVFYQTWHRFVFDSVIVAEQLFIERSALSGPTTYAIPDEVRPLLGNLGSQRTDPQIELAIDAAYDEINTKTNRIPPNDWKDTDHNFGIVKKLTRYIAAKEMAIGIKDFDTKPLEMEIEHLFNDLLTYDTTSDATQDIVGSSPDVTYALSDAGLIWSTRYKNLRKSSSSENDTTINPNT